MCLLRIIRFATSPTSFSRSLPAISPLSLMGSDHLVQKRFTFWHARKYHFSSQKWLCWKKYLFTYSVIWHSSFRRKQSCNIKYRKPNCRKENSRSLIFSSLAIFPPLCFVPQPSFAFGNLNLHNPLPPSQGHMETKIKTACHGCHNLLHGTRKAVYDCVANSKCSKIKSVEGKSSHCKTQGRKFELFSSFYQQRGMILNAG